LKYFAQAQGVERNWAFAREGGRLVAREGDRELELDLALLEDGKAFSVLVDGVSHDVVVERVAGATFVHVRGERIRVDVVDERERAALAVRGAAVRGPQRVGAVMPGVVVEVLVAVGDEVAAGQTLVVLEAMKMQNPLQAEAAGVVSRILVQRGQAVAGGAVLVEIEAE
jgi:pyruvate carboxylase subunit B